MQHEMPQEQFKVHSMTKKEQELDEEKNLISSYPIPINKIHKLDDLTNIK